MNEYEKFKKWVNSFEEKIYYKLKPPTKDELYEIVIEQQEEIERLKKENSDLQNIVNIETAKSEYLEQRIDKAIEYINACPKYLWTNVRTEELLNILQGSDKD